ncbi:antitoxin VapB family protein [Halorubrum sp. CSM-61]|uniref:antitoxin VapB family protein n=1 Tax=Halorubrum sp. CSM-61 TaxID=2485838 RepID=UPI000F4B6652|nr:antitoxin VapB family protein [Halorubrum sp. CSM-61]
MSTRNVRLDEDVYERIKSEKRPGETFSETVERLIGGSSLLDLAGILSDEEADEFRRAIEESDEAGTREVDELVDRFDGVDDT